MGSTNFSAEDAHRDPTRARLYEVHERVDEALHVVDEEDTERADDRVERLGRPVDGGHVPRAQFDVLEPRLDDTALGDRQHLFGVVQPLDSPGGADPLGGVHQTVSSAAGHVEDPLAGDEPEAIDGPQREVGPVVTGGVVVVGCRGVVGLFRVEAAQRAAHLSSNGCAVGDEAVLDGEQGGGGAGRHTQLGVDVLDVAARRLGRHAQLAGDLLVRRTPRQQHEHLDLPRRQPGRARRSLTAAVAGGCEDRVHRRAIQATTSRLGPQLTRCLARGHRPSVRTVLTHGVVGVGGREDLRQGADRRARGTPVVPRTIQAFVTCRGHRPDLGQRGRTREHALGVVVVQADPLELGRGERSRLVPDRVGDTGSADVVRQRRSPSQSDVDLRVTRLLDGRGDELARRPVNDPRRTVI